MDLLLLQFFYGVCLNMCVHFGAGNSFYGVWTSRVPFGACKAFFWKFPFTAVLARPDLVFFIDQTHSDTGMWIAHVPLCIFALHLIKILIPVYYGHLCTLSLCLCPSIRYSVPLLFRIFFWQIWSHSIRSLSIHMKYIQTIHDPWSISSSLSSIQGLVTLDKCELDAVPLWLVKGRID